MSSGSAEKRVWVIGAGASKSHTNGAFPTLLELSQQAAKLGIFNPTTKRPAGTYEQLVKYVRRRFGTALDDSKTENNLELIYTTIELDLLTKPDPVLEIARSQLLRLLRQTIRTIQSRDFNSTHEYDWLVEHIRDRDSIITFNWDVLLDNILKRREILKDRHGKTDAKNQLKGQYWNFIFELTAWGEATIKRLPLPPPYETRAWNGDSGYYLKANGSIDWYYCSNRHCRGAAKTYPVLDTRKRWFCGSCQESMQLLLVPPTLNKAIREVPLLRRIWNVAALELSLATEVVLWGYSLPPTDFFSDWLLRQARTKRCRHISVINPSVVDQSGAPIAGSLNGPFVNRFHSTFRSLHDTRAFSFYRSFADYKNGISI